MARTSFNPITTKWSGKVGAFTYRIVRGKQVIAANAEMPKTDATTSQAKTRAKFKLGAQFSNLWFDSIIRAFMRPRIADKIEARGQFTGIVFKSATTTETIIDDLPQIMAQASITTVRDALNARFNRTNTMGTLVINNQASPATVTFTPAGDPTGILQMVSWGKNGIVVDKQIKNLEVGATTSFELPTAVDGMPILRWDVMVLPFEVNNLSAWSDNYANMIAHGNDGNLSADLCDVFVAATSDEVLSPQALSATSATRQTP